MNLFILNAGQAGLEFTCHADSLIPKNLLGDPARLQQVLVNLVGNAFKFTKSGKISVEAASLQEADASRHRVLFSVTDTGIGIPESKFGNLFVPFTQASDGYTRQFLGAGLGLSICKRLVELMDGEISIESEEGSGTTVNFSVSFQIANSQGLPAGNALAQGPYGTLTVSLRTLLAENDDLNAVLTKRLLEHIGCMVNVAINGRQALEMLRRERYDMVIMDVQMPVMGAVEAARRIRGGEAGPETAGIPIIALTAQSTEDDRSRFLEAGMNRLPRQARGNGSTAQSDRRGLGHDKISGHGPCFQIRYKKNERGNPLLAAELRFCPLALSPFPNVLEHLTLEKR